MIKITLEYIISLQNLNRITSITISTTIANIIRNVSYMGPASVLTIIVVFPAYKAVDGTLCATADIDRFLTEGSQHISKRTSS
jgi:hypothetical protein